MAYPILEYDPEREALINPHDLASAVKLPEHGVLCFFREVLDRVVAEHSARLVTQFQWEDGPHPVYELTYQGNKVAFLHPGVGAAHAAGLLEEVIPLGVRKVVVCGGSGVLDSGIGLGKPVVLNAALRDEGVSYHYLPPAREVAVDADAVKVLAHTLDRHGIPYCVGKSWTTDAPYRETRGKIARRRAEGCCVVEMEAAALLAVAQFRGIKLGYVVYGGDDVGGEVWDARDWRNVGSVRERLFWLSVEACLAL